MFKWIYKKFFAPLVASQVAEYTSSRTTINSQFDTVFNSLKESRKFSSLELEEIGQTLAGIIEDKVEEEVLKYFESAGLEDKLDSVPNAEEVAELAIEEIASRLRS